MMHRTKSNFFIVGACDGLTPRSQNSDLSLITLRKTKRILSIWVQCRKIQIDRILLVFRSVAVTRRCSMNTTLSSVNYLKTALFEMKKTNIILALRIYYNFSNKFQMLILCWSMVCLFFSFQIMQLLNNIVICWNVRFLTSSFFLLHLFNWKVLLWKELASVCK